MGGRGTVWRRLQILRHRPHIALGHGGWRIALPLRKEGEGGWHFNPTTELRQGTPGARSGKCVFRCGGIQRAIHTNVIHNPWLIQHDLQ